MLLTQAATLESFMCMCVGGTGMLFVKCPFKNRVGEIRGESLGFFSSQI